MSEQILEQLRQAMRDSGKSLGELADATGIDKSQLSRFANGQTDLGLIKCAALADALGMKITLTRSRRRKK
jgi:transcriptional regulator with XRE-family HTH domain